MAIGNRFVDDGLVGESLAIRRIRALIAKVAPTHLPVLIQGPTGSGKELVARALHRASGRPGALVAFNIAAVAETLFEDALFGHVRGAFSGAVSDRAGYLAEANGGTVSFDPNLRAEILDTPGMREALRTVLSKTDLFLPSGEELFLFTTAQTETEAVADLLARGIKAIVIKRGAAGATYHDAGLHLHLPGFEVEEVDPTGAGDCFGATFVTFWLRGASPAVALRYANASGARAVTKAGPMEGASTEAELRSLIETQGIA